MDPKLQSRLAAVRSKLRLQLVIDGVAWMLLVLLSVVLTGVLLDWWLRLPGLVRGVLLCSGVGGAAYVQRAVCRSGHGVAVERFVDDDDAAGSCPVCGDPLRAEPFFRHDPTPSRLLITRIDRPLGRLCDEPPAWVLVTGNGNAVLFRGEGRQER